IWRSIERFMACRETHCVQDFTVVPPKDKLTTLLPFVAASGRIYMILLIFQEEKGGEDDGVARTRIPVEEPIKVGHGVVPVYYAVTEKGFMTLPLWKSVVKKFCIEATGHVGFGHALLVLDNLASHLDFDSAFELEKHGVHCLFLPPHTT